MKKILFALCLLPFFTSLAVAQYKTLDPNDENDPDAPRFWSEVEVQLPQDGPSNDLRPFYVSANTPLTFAIDAKSLSIGKDDVTRYVIVITSPSGARQITFEGIRCEKFEWRNYASYQISEKKWVRNPSSSWLRIQGGSYNRYHAALVQDAFCDINTPRRNREDILRLLKP